MKKRVWKFAKVILVFTILVILLRIFNYVAVVTEDSLLERNENGVVFGAEPVFENGCDTSVLLIHGFGSSPSDFWGLYSFLNDQGVTYSTPLLKGHGTSIFDFEKSTRYDWINSAEVAYKNLPKEDKVILVGNSMGSVIALNLAAKYDFDHVILFNAPVKLKPKALYFLPLIGVFERFHLRNVFRDDPANEFTFTYKAVPIKAINEILLLIDEEKINLGKVNDPILIFQSEKDTLVDPESANLIYDLTSSTDKKLVFLQNSTHSNIASYDALIIEKSLRDVINC